tara:strand:+ start:1190 stop:1855 length:666 start_codon:yes stop_codon:yes gene_type:complete
MKNRSKYKQTWNALAEGIESAKKFVSGFQDEDEFTRTALKTINIFKETVDIKPTDQILEIGCGVGRVGKELASICNHWTGSDISGNMLEHAKDRLTGLHNVKLVELTEVGLNEFEDGTFDMVYSTVVFMHLLEWDRYSYVEEAFRVLRPGGRCFVDNIDITSNTGKKMFMEGHSYKPDERPDYLSMVSSGDELVSYLRWAGFQKINLLRWDDAWVGAYGTK